MTIWAPAERFDLAERSQTASQIGEPLPSINQSVLQKTPDELPWIDSLKKQAQTQRLL